MMSKEFWKEVISSKSTESAKRVVTLASAGWFFISSFVILFIASYSVFYLPKGKVDPLILDILKELIEYNVYIILGGLTFIGVENIGQVLIEKAKTKAASFINSPTVQTEIKKEQINDL